MKTITVEELEERYEEIIDDVADNNTHYLVKCDQGDVVLVPCSSYDFLLDTYQSWVKEIDSENDFEDLDESSELNSSDAEFS